MIQQGYNRVEQENESENKHKIDHIHNYMRPTQGYYEVEQANETLKSARFLIHIHVVTILVNYNATIFSIRHACVDRYCMLLIDHMVDAFSLSFLYAIFQSY